MSTCQAASEGSRSNASTTSSGGGRPTVSNHTLRTCSRGVAGGLGWMSTVAIRALKMASMAPIS